MISDDTDSIDNSDDTDENDEKELCRLQTFVTKVSGLQTS